MDQRRYFIIRNSIEFSMLKGTKIYSFGIPFLLVIFALTGFVGSIFLSKKFEPVSSDYFEVRGKDLHNAGRFNILSENDIIPGMKDTVYTDMDCWLELNVSEQRLYQHWRNGKTETYLVSTGAKNGDPTSLESRPGLFAIFMKTEHHKSSQFNSANMYHFMPFNQGIGFHSIDGTGYYAHLGVRPSSHGCIRMKHNDAEKLFSDCPMGTLVLVTKGRSARVVAFAPKDFRNDHEYSKEDYKWMLATNLRNLLTGNYFTEERERFILDPKVIPKSGVYSGYDVDVPEKQIIPRGFAVFTDTQDKLSGSASGNRLKVTDEMIRLVSDVPEISNESFEEEKPIDYDNEVIKEYFSNPIGVLPYFGPKK